MECETSDAVIYSFWWLLLVQMATVGRGGCPIKGFERIDKTPGPSWDSATLWRNQDVVIGSSMTNRVLLMEIQIVTQTLPP
jgi:hypothetical protein